MWVAFKGNAASVDALLQHVEINKAAIQSEDGKNSIHFACEGGKHEALLCLLKQTEYLIQKRKALCQRSAFNFGSPACLLVGPLEL